MKIIAETASNHMGEIDYLKKLSLESVKAGADFVTVQVFDLEEFVTPYDQQSYNNFKKVFLSKKTWKDYFKWCKLNDIRVIPCVLDNSSADLCYEEGYRFVKIHASDITNYDFLKKVNRKFKKILLEFGGSTLEEINRAIQILKDVEVVLLYGFNAYPTKLENQNLNFLDTLSFVFKRDVGFADHSVNNEYIPLLAMAKNATYLEKHVTLEKDNENRFDWQVSVEPQELRKLTVIVKENLKALGKPLREISESEKHFRKLVYKKIIAAKDLKKGDKITKEDLVAKRSISGMESSEIEKLIGKVIKTDVQKGEPITVNHF